MTRPTRIISGGQSGADQTALIVAREMGIPTGGTVPKGWRTEEGPAPWLAEYGLVESSVASYPARTYLNVQAADATVLFGEIGSPGSRQTIQACRRANRPFIVNPSPSELTMWCWLGGYAVLNIAGNRRSRNPQVEKQVRWVLTEAFGGQERG